jgi:hypothetical protein
MTTLRNTIWTAALLLLPFLLLYAGAASAYESVELQDAFSVSGRVTYSGSIDHAPPYTGAMSTYCSKEGLQSRYDLKDSGLNDVVVWIEGIDQGAGFRNRNAEIVIKDCFIFPLVNIGFVGGEYKFTNSDDDLHTIQLKVGLKNHSQVSGRDLSRGATIYNFAMPRKGMTVKKRIKKYHVYSDKRGLIQITSNTDPWMRGYIFIFDHPYAVVTSVNGAFTIDNVPPGEYVLKLWHEAAGLKETRITVKENKGTSVEIDMAK